MRTCSDALHTYLSEQGHDYLKEHGQCLPLEIRLVSNDLYAYKDFTPGEAIPRGSQVLSINTQPTTEIIERVRASLPDGRGIPPDIEVQPTIHDLIAGRDIVLNKAISLIESQ